MNHSTHISKSRHTLGMVLGAFVALAILFSQSFYFDYVSTVKGDAQVEYDGGGAESSDTVIEMAQQALSTVADFAVQTVLHFIAEIFTIDKTETAVYTESYTGFTPYFQALFKLIIAPNAP